MEQIQELEKRINNLSDIYKSQDWLLKIQYDTLNKLFENFAKKWIYFLMRKQNNNWDKKNYLFVGTDNYFETWFWKFDKKIVPYNQNFTIPINIVFFKNWTFTIWTTLQSYKKEVQFFEDNILKKIHEKIPDFKETWRNFETLAKKEEWRIAYSTEKMSDFSKIEEYINKISEVLEDIDWIEKVSKDEFIKMANKRLDFISKNNNLIKKSENRINSSNKNIMPKSKTSKLLDTKKQIILYWPPWTWKTYNVENIIENHSQEKYSDLQNDWRVEFITFHQSFSYEEFIEWIKPDLDWDSEEISYKIEDWIFKKIVNKAKQKDKNHYLVIDEINRWNISKIFGELITLLEADKRLWEENKVITKLPYSKEDFWIPLNLFIVATMNTSDKSIVSLDTALRRRFWFVEMLPDYDLPELDKNIEWINLGELLHKINNRIEYLIDKDHLIGHSYFLKINSLEDFKLSIYNEIYPLLEEYFYGEEEKIRLVLWSKLFKKKNIDKNLFEDKNDFENDEKKYEINKELNNEYFINALKNIIKSNETN